MRLALPENEFPVAWSTSSQPPPGRPRLAGVMAVVPQLPLGAVASPGPPRALPARPSPCVCPHIAGAAIRPGAIKGWLFAPELSVVGLGASLAFPSKRSRQRRCVGPSSSPSSSSGHAVAVYALTADAGRRRTRRGWRGARDLGRTGSSPRAAASECVAAAAERDASSPSATSGISGRRCAQFTCGLVSNQLMARAMLGRRAAAPQACVVQRADTETTPYRAPAEY